MVRGLREMVFRMNHRCNRTLHATIRKLQRDPTVAITVEMLPDSVYRVLMDSDHQDFIRLDAKLRHIVNGRIEKKTLS